MSSVKWWRREKEDKGPLQSVGVGLGLGLGRWSGGDALAIDRTTERTRNKSGKEGRKEGRESKVDLEGEERQERQEEEKAVITGGRTDGRRYGFGFRKGQQERRGGG